MMETPSDRIGLDSSGASSAAKTIALCEDDVEIRNLLAVFLNGEGYTVILATDGEQLERHLDISRVDLIILDWMLPGEDGLSICRRLRTRAGAPIIMLTARDEDADRIAGLETGADDYVTKPFNPHVLLAHIRAVLRRPGAPPASSDRIRIADLSIMKDSRQALRGTVEVNLTAAEFDLLLCFARRPQRVLSREQLMNWTRGRMSGSFDRTVDVQVSRLRRKLEIAGSETAGLIRAVRNAGYILVAPAVPG